MKKILFSGPEGLTVVHLPPKGDEDTLLAEAIKRLPVDAQNVTVVDASEIPTDRTFRNAWRYNGSFKVDMPAARELQKNRLRALRAPILQRLDVAYIRALESGDQVKCAAIVSQKQVLRDVTEDPSIAAASTPEELKMAIPAVLTEK